MRANSPSSYAASLAIHGLLVALIVLFSLYVRQTQLQEKPPAIFELVAGPPTSPFEKEAPALGTTSVKLEIPKVAAKVDPQPAEPEVVEEEEPAPVVKTPVEPPPQPKAKETPKKETPKPKPVELSKESKKIVNDMNKKRMTSYLNEKKKIDRARAQEEAARKARESAALAKAPKRIDVEGIRDGVKGGKAGVTGGGGGKVAVRDDGPAMEMYQAALINRLRFAHDEIKPQGLGDTLTADVQFVVAANGEISNIRIVRSSGNAEFDASVREAFRRITYLGPRPDKKSDTWEVTFRMKEID
jgi:colicin import membrane protein